MGDGHYVLEIQPAGQRPEVRELSQAVTLIGRRHGEIVISDRGASSRHAELHFDGRGVQVIDVGSTNGTLFHGEITNASFALPVGEHFQIGRTRFTLISLTVDSRLAALEDGDDDGEEIEESTHVASPNWDLMAAEEMAMSTAESPALAVDRVLMKQAEEAVAAAQAEVEAAANLPTGVADVPEGLRDLVGADPDEPTAPHLPPTAEAPSYVPGVSLPFPELGSGGPAPDLDPGTDPGTQKGVAPVSPPIGTDLVPSMDSGSPGLPAGLVDATEEEPEVGPSGQEAEDGFMATAMAPAFTPELAASFQASRAAATPEDGAVLLGNQVSDSFRDSTFDVEELSTPEATAFLVEGDVPHDHEAPELRATGGATTADNGGGEDKDIWAATMAQEAVEDPTAKANALPSAGIVSMREGGSATSSGVTPEPTTGNGPGAKGLLDTVEEQPTRVEMSERTEPPSGAPTHLDAPAPPPVPSTTTGQLALGVRPLFGGTGGDAFPQVAVGVALTILTAGLYGAWFAVRLRRWLTTHTRVAPTRHGTVQLVFTGTGGQLFLKGFVGCLLSVATLGVYGFWFAADLMRFFAEHTEGHAEDGTVYQVRLTMTGGNLFAAAFPAALLSLVTAGLFIPWFICAVQRTSRAHLHLFENGAQIGAFGFLGTGGQLFGTFIVGYLLTLLTAGIYGAWLSVGIRRFALASTRAQVHGQLYQGIFLGTGGKLFVTAFLGFVLCVVTLGVYSPWLWAQLKQFRLNNTVFIPIVPGA